METLIIQRLVEMTFAPLDEVADWLTRLGLEVERQEESVLVVRNPYLHITTALMAGSDPVTRAVCLGFALAASAWTALCPRLLDEVNREWRLRRKKQAAETAARQDKDVSSDSPPPKEQPRRKPPPAAEPTFADLYKTQDPGA
jgi:hypothetical protein